MADDALPEASALFLEALPVLLAHAAAMRAVGERTVGVPCGAGPGGVDPDALPEAVAHALSNVAAAGDAARARATLACVCSDARAAADAASPASQRQGDAARAVTCDEIATALQHRSMLMLAHCTPVLQRLCAAAMPPPATMEPADAVGAQPRSAADAWQQLWRRVQTSMAGLQDELSIPSLHDDVDDDDDGPPGLVEDYATDAAALLQLIGATEAEAAAAKAELHAYERNPSVADLQLV